MLTIRITLFLLLIGTLELSAQQVVLMQNANVWDGTSESLMISLDVMVVDNLISEVNEDIQEPEGAMIIDATGKTLIPDHSEAHARPKRPPQKIRL